MCVCVDARKDSWTAASCTDESPDLRGQPEGPSLATLFGLLILYLLFLHWLCTIIDSRILIKGFGRRSRPSRWTVRGCRMGKFIVSGTVVAAPDFEMRSHACCGERRRGRCWCREGPTYENPNPTLCCCCFCFCFCWIGLWTKQEQHQHQKRTHKSPPVLWPSE